MKLVDRKTVSDYSAAVDNKFYILDRRLESKLLQVRTEHAAAPAIIDKIA